MEHSTNDTKGTIETAKFENLKARADLYHPPPIVPKIELHPKNPRKSHLTHSSSANSSSPDSPLDNDPFDSDDEKSSNESFSPRAHKPNHSQPPLLDINIDCKNDDNCSSPTTVVPCNQTMERAGPIYRIPPSVFARTGSGPPADWSVASNESLFSISGTSFKKSNHLCWRSGELPIGPAEAREGESPDQIFSYPGRKGRCGEAMRSRELGLAEATMKEVIEESEAHQHYVTTLAETSMKSGRREARTKSTSTKSFAFSIKARDSAKDASTGTHGSVRSIAEEHRCQPQTVLTKPDDRTGPQPSANIVPTASPAPPPSVGRARWPSCFSCCSIR